jgi:hypothetical protein
MEPHRFDGVARGPQAHLRVLLGGVVNHRAHAEFFTHRGDEA